MNVKIAAMKMIPRIVEAHLPEVNDEYGKDHLIDMVIKITSDEVTGEKAHRWLGWIQACVCMGRGASLEELKNINHQS